MSKYEGMNVQTLNALIAGKIHRRRQLDKEIVTLRSQRSRLIAETVVGDNRSGTQDKEAVPTIELLPYIEAAVREFTTKGLARRANVSARTIHKIRKSETKFTTLRIADALLSASGRTDVLGRSVRIVPNPAFRIDVDNGDNCG